MDVPKNSKFKIQNLELDFVVIFLVFFVLLRVTFGVFGDLVEVEFVF